MKKGTKGIAEWEKYQYDRAENARQWLYSPAYRLELEKDVKRRATIDALNGHSTKCALTKCHPNCKNEGKNWGVTR